MVFRSCAHLHCLLQALPDTRSQHTASQALMVEQQALQQKIKFKRAEAKQTQEELAASKVGCCLVYTIKQLVMKGMISRN